MAQSPYAYAYEFWDDSDGTNPHVVLSERQVIGFIHGDPSRVVPLFNQPDPSEVVSRSEYEALAEKYNRTLTELRDAKEKAEQYERYFRQIKGCIDTLGAPKFDTTFPT